MEETAKGFRTLAAAVKELDPASTGEGDTHYAAIYLNSSAAGKIKRRKATKDLIVRWAKS
jgi:hypothetical protein